MTQLHSWVKCEQKDVPFGEAWGLQNKWAKQYLVTLACGHQIIRDRAPEGPGSYQCAECPDPGRTTGEAIQGEGATYEPWIDLDQAAVGWKVTRTDGQVEYVTLVPSFNEPAGEENMFLYQGPESFDMASITYVNLFDDRSWNDDPAEQVEGKREASREVVEHFDALPGERIHERTTL